MGHGQAPHAARAALALRDEALVSCAEATSVPLSLRPHEPLTVLVHGCKSSPARLANLKEQLSQEGQQVACYRYDYRDTIRTTGLRLRAALRRAEQQLAPSEIVVIGHSQGGLVARAAFHGRQPALHGSYRLVSIAAPFGGIAAARGCGSRALHAASFGITVAVCRGIAGKVWRELHPRAETILHPAPLDAVVSDHLMVTTDERGTFRVAPDGPPAARMDDYTFSLDEQHNARIERDPRVSTVALAVGHVTVIGESGRVPETLLDVLRAGGHVSRATTTSDD